MNSHETTSKLIPGPQQTSYFLQGTTEDEAEAVLDKVMMLFRCVCIAAPSVVICINIRSMRTVLRLFACVLVDSRAHAYRHLQVHSRERYI